MRLIQDGWLTAIYGRNLFRAISPCWIEILTSKKVHCTSKRTAELTFCQMRLIKDGQLTAIYGQNLFWAITRYWIEILTSKVVRWYLKMNSWVDLSRSSDSRWPTDRDIWSKPILGHNLVLDWDIPMARICWPTGRGIPSDALRRMLGPEFSAFHSVLDWDIDFKFCVLVP